VSWKPKVDEDLLAKLINRETMGIRLGRGENEA
jgi:hypothetical protein